MTSDPRSGEPVPFGTADDATTVHPAEPSPWAPGGAAAGPAAAGEGAPASPSAGTPAGSPAQPAGPASHPFDRPAALPPVAVERPVVRSRGSGMLVNVLLGVALVVAVGGVAFAAGRATAPASTPTGRNFGANGQGGFILPGGAAASGAPGALNGGFGGGGLSIEGTVTAVSADSITVQLASGQSVTIPTNADTTYHSQAAATAADVTSGSTVRVQLQGNGRGVFGNGNGNGGQGVGPNGSGAPGRTLGAASSITLVPAGS